MSHQADRGRWLAIIGIGEGGVETLSAAARTLVATAELVVGGARHLKLAGDLVRGDRLAWPRPIGDAVPAILARRGRPVAVLASGDPFLYGIGSLLASAVARKEMVCLPQPSAFALACARLAWSGQDAALVSLCGRRIETVAPLLQPGRRMVALSADGATPAALASYLVGRGFGPSVLHVLEALDGPRERVRSATADGFGLEDVDPLNVVGIEVVAGMGAQVIPLAAGLADELFETDGQLTKREIRAVTLSSLAPRAGELLWDVGCGSGSVAIEWALRHPANRAVGIEGRADRAARAARNAACLGVPHVEIVAGEAPAALEGLARPDAVFIGGGMADGVLEAAWAALKPGGRMVVNGVTVETEARLIAAQERLGGTMARIAVERLDRIGSMHGFRPAMTVTQWQAVKA